MRFQGFALVVLGLLASAVRADDGAAWALIDEAIRAHGGAAALAKCATATLKTEGIFQGYDRTPVFFHTCEATMRGADQYRMTVHGKVYEQSFHIVNILNGKQGWIKQASDGAQDVRECTPAQLADFQECGYVNWIATLVPLVDRDFDLALAGEREHHGRSLVGVRVSSRGRRDATLFFDKQTHLLVKTETRGMAGTGVEGTVETIRGRYKEFDGVRLPISWEVYYNGRCLWSHHVLEYQLADEPAPGAFAKP